MTTKYGIILTLDSKTFSNFNIPQSSEYGIMDKYKIPLNISDADLLKICNTIESSMEEILDKGIKVRFEVLLDSELQNIEKKVYNRLGTVTVVQIEGRRRI